MRFVERCVIASLLLGLVAPLHVIGAKEGEIMSLGIDGLVNGLERLSRQVKALESRSGDLSQALGEEGSPAAQADVGSSPSANPHGPTPPPVPIPANMHTWLPNSDGAGPWTPAYPEIFSAKAVVASPTNQLPGYHSKRFALVFRGDSFRVLSYGVTACYTQDPGGRVCNKQPYYCTDEAVAIQKASAKAQVGLMIEPLEKAGYTVDVYVSTYGCNGLPHVPAEKAAQYHQELLDIFGSRVVASYFFEREKGQTQDTGTKKSNGIASH